MEGSRIAVVEGPTLTELNRLEGSRIASDDNAPMRLVAMIVDTGDKESCGFTCCDDHRGIFIGTSEVDITPTFNIILG